MNIKKFPVTVPIAALKVNVPLAVNLTQVSAPEVPVEFPPV